MHALIITEVCNTDLSVKYETFPGDRDSVCAIAALGTKEELKTLVDSYPERTDTFDFCGRPRNITYAVMEDGSKVFCHIVRVGKI